MKINIAGVLKHSSVNGPGVRYVLFTQGCIHNCAGCQNPETHDGQGGSLMDVEDVAQDILETKYLDGVTLSGGDPFYRPEAMLELLKILKSKNMNIWVYTGWKLEDILEGKPGEGSRESLDYIDVLVDGRFNEELKSSNCIYRGSTNQRLIDIKATLEQGSIVEYRP